MSLTNQIALEAMFIHVDKAHKDIAKILCENPQCLNGNPRKDEIIQMLISHLKAKMHQSQSDEEKANRASSIQLAVLVECFEDEKSLEYARKVLKCLMDLSVQELKYVPEELKQEAFKIVEAYVRKI